HDAPPATFVELLRSPSHSQPPPGEAVAPVRPRAAARSPRPSRIIAGGSQKAPAPVAVPGPAPACAAGGVYGMPRPLWPPPPPRRLRTVVEPKRDTPKTRSMGAITLAR